MNPPGVVVVIPTRQRSDLLERTLHSLAQCKLPLSLKHIVVAENGSESTAAALVAGFQNRLPIQHRFDANTNKCGALNRATAGLDRELVVFFDDDIRIHPDTLQAYAESAERYGEGVFFGGRCRVDYDEAPEPWLLRYLPNSAKGWSAGSDTCEFHQPKALGFNWAVFAADLQSVGGFDERCGPGTRANGDEVLVQSRLLRRGVKGRFLPDATVWHYVPRERCSPEWALQRRRQTAMGSVVSLADSRWTTQLRRKAACHLKLLFYHSLLRAGGDRLAPRTQYHYRYRTQTYRGTLDGLRLLVAAEAADTPPEATKGMTAGR